MIAPQRSTEHAVDPQEQKRVILLSKKFRCLLRPVLLLGILPIVSCNISLRDILSPPVETRFLFLNLSKTYYASFAFREHIEGDNTSDYVSTLLLAPGAALRGDLLDTTGIGCPNSLDFRVFLYKRVNADRPIGEDPGETVEESPIVAGTVEDLPACNIRSLESYTVVSWDAPEGTARVKFAQGTEVEEAIRASNRFPNDDAVWEVDGVDSELAGSPPPDLAPNEPIAGRVILADGTGVESVGVLLRSRFRVRLDDESDANDPDSGFGEPIAIARTEPDGAFRIDRPAGAYQVEFFSDVCQFRPPSVFVESPNESIRIVVECME